MLVGTLDELAELPAADEFKGMKEVEYDFRGLQFINSVGITKFIRLNGEHSLHSLNPLFLFNFVICTLVEFFDLLQFVVKILHLSNGFLKSVIVAIPL